MDYYKAGGDSA